MYSSSDFPWSDCVVNNFLNGVISENILEQERKTEITIDETVSNTIANNFEKEYNNDNGNNNDNDNDDDDDNDDESKSNDDTNGINPSAINAVVHFVEGSASGNQGKKLEQINRSINHYQLFQVDLSEFGVDPLAYLKNIGTAYRKLSLV